MTEEIIIDGGRMAGITTLKNEIARLEQENRELKEEIQFHNKENSNLLAERNAAQIGYDEIREVKERYRSALEEINITVKQLLQGVSSNCINNTPYLTALSLIENKINEALQ